MKKDEFLFRPCWFSNCTVTLRFKAQLRERERMMIGMYRVCAVYRIVILYDRYVRVCTNHPVIRKDWSFRLVWSILSCIRGGRCGVRGWGECINCSQFPSCQRKDFSDGNV